MTTVYFDYACEQTYRIYRWLEMAEVQADWRPFSLVQARLEEGAKPVWSYASSLPLSVLALVGHEFVNAQGGAGIKAYCSEVFRLFHAEADEPSEGKLWRLIEKYTGHPKDNLDIEAALGRVKHSHELAASKRVFDSPTIFVGTSDKPYYLRIEALPESARSAKSLWSSLPKCAGYFPEPVTIESVD